MRKKMKNLPLFPLIPLVPAALLVGSVVTSFRALACVRRLERRLGGTERPPATD